MTNWPIGQIGMEDDNFVPDSLITFIRQRSNRNEQTRFPYKLFSLLGWAGKDEVRGENAGCGWFTDNEFFIDKAKLCEVMNVKLNTLNVNLRTLGFEQSRNRAGNKNFYRNEGFNYGVKNMKFERIRNSRCKPEALLNLKISAVYLPCLEPLQLFMMSRQDIDQFKRDVVITWEKLTGQNKLVFALSLDDFSKALSNSFEGLYNDMYGVQQVLSPRVPNIMDIFDFAVFLARFGPFNSIQAKLSQYQHILQEIRNDVFLFNFNQSPPNSYFADTFHNCFRFQQLTFGEYHIYNLPHVSTNAGFLADEDGVIYPSWNKMISQNKFLTGH